MTVASELIRAKEDYREVYNAGIDKGKAIGGYDQGLEDGKQAEYDAFWDIYQEKGKRVHYAYAFAGGGWTKDTFKPKYQLNNITNCLYMFCCFNLPAGNGGLYDLKQGLSDMDIVFDISKATNIANMFSSSKISVVPTLDCSGMETVATFLGYSSIETIEKMIVNEGHRFDYSFSNADKLKNIVFEGVIGKSVSFQWSPLLSRDSIVNIVNTLSTAASGQTLTLSGTAVNNAFTGGSDGSEWQALISTKPNWTISLV